MNALRNKATSEDLGRFPFSTSSRKDRLLAKAFWVWHGSDHMKPKVTRHTRSLSSQFDPTQLHFSVSTTDLLGSLRFYSLDIVGYQFIAIPQGKGNKLSILQVPSIPMNQFAQSGGLMVYSGQARSDLRSS